MSDNKGSRQSADGAYTSYFHGDQGTEDQYNLDDFIGDILIQIEALRVKKVVRELMNHSCPLTGAIHEDDSKCCQVNDQGNPILQDGVDNTPENRKDPTKWKAIEFSEEDQETCKPILRTALKNIKGAARKHIEGKDIMSLPQLLRLLKKQFDPETAVSAHAAIVDVVTTPFDLDPNMDGKELAKAIAAYGATKLSEAQNKIKRVTVEKLALSGFLNGLPKMPGWTEMKVHLLKDTRMTLTKAVHEAVMYASAKAEEGENPAQQARFTLDEVKALIAAEMKKNNMNVNQNANSQKPRDPKTGKTFGQLKNELEQANKAKEIAQKNNNNNRFNNRDDKPPCKRCGYSNHATNQCTATDYVAAERLKKVQGGGGNPSQTPNKQVKKPFKKGGGGGGKGRGRK